MQVSDHDPDYDVGPGPLASLWRYRLASSVVIVLAVLVGVIHGVLAAPPTKSLARIGLANPRGLTVILGGSASGADLGRYASARARFAESTDVLATAARSLKDGTSLATLQTVVEVTATADADVLIVTATGSGAEQAERRADAVVAAFRELTLQATNDTVNSQLAAVARAQAQLDQLFTPGPGDSARAAAAATALGELQQTAARAQTEAALFGSGTVFVENATVPHPSSGAARAERGGLLGLLLGVLLAGTVAWLRAGRRREVGDGEAAARLLGTRLLGEVPATGERGRFGERDRSAERDGVRERRGVRERGGIRRRGRPGDRGRADEADGPRSSPQPGHHAAAGVLTAVGGRGLYVLASPGRQDGRTATALGLATALAAGGCRVALVDGDLRTGRLTARFGLPAAAVGLAQLARGTTDLATAIRTYSTAEGGELAFVPRGQLATDPAGLLGRAELTETMGRLKKLFDIVLVDTPATGPTADAFLLAATATGIIAVARWRTPGGPLRRLRAQADATAVPLVGVVLTHGPRVRGGYQDAYGDQIAFDVERTQTLRPRTSGDRPDRTPPHEAAALHKSPVHRPSVHKPSVAARL
ncbi:hypothetical protein [Parafrankia sp. EUN1f]|uniref:hypothetical protein n=1 Tax=Parafrankia sp. EUN1f TaxID=102897 RepID=UPI0001C4511E|nr:hypothetical protein [Parafrankia sp. EUN1f]EFC84988.1 lipopolysaccharide biosynthesis protein [Parafrankia sp. EUN1f]